MTSITKTKTICGYCGTGCGLVVEVENNEIIRVRGDKDTKINSGQTCVKGAFAYKYVHSKDRLSSPLIRKNGELVPASWQEALDLIVTKLKGIKNSFGPDAISLFACARATNETNFITQKFMRAAIGSNHIDGCNRT